MVQFKKWESDLLLPVDRKKVPLPHRMLKFRKSAPSGRATGEFFVALPLRLYVALPLLTQTDNGAV